MPLLPPGVYDFLQGYCGAAVTLFKFDSWRATDRLLLGTQLVGLRAVLFASEGAQEMSTQWDDPAVQTNWDDFVSRCDSWYHYLQVCSTQNKYSTAFNQHQLDPLPQIRM
jgi:hypothetical protein